MGDNRKFDVGDIVTWSKHQYSADMILRFGPGPFRVRETQDASSYRSGVGHDQFIVPEKLIFGYWMVWTDKAGHWTLPPDPKVRLTVMERPSEFSGAYFENVPVAVQQSMEVSIGA